MAKAIAVYLLVLGCWLSACGLNKGGAASTENATASVTQSPKRSIVEKLRENEHLGLEGQVALYHQLKKESPDAYTFDNEDELTMYGYSFLWADMLPEALVVFQLVVAEFPDSANPYDSLGEAYLKSGNKELALANYAKSLALNPDNFNAEDQIERIQYPDKVPEKLTDKFSKIFTAQAYKTDLDQLGNTLIKGHPNALKFISKAAFWKAIEEKKALITDQTTYGEFAWHCSEIIANVNCSHTNMGSFDYEAAMLTAPLYFPIQTRWVSNRLFVVNPLGNGTKVKVKDEILRINGVAVSDIVSASYRHIPSQGYVETTKNHFFNTWSAAMIPYALGFPKTYQITIKGAPQPVVLEQAAATVGPFVDTSIDNCGNDLCLEFLAGGKTALLTVASFNYYRWSDFNVFEQFIDSSFHEIRKRGISNLIIDLRLNRGGSQSASIHLLRYLVDQPFTYFSNAQFEGKTEKIEGETVTQPFENRFKGKSYYIIDGKGNSTTGHFMSIVKYLKVGTIIGEELGSNQFCSAGMHTYRLRNTKLEYYVANNTHESLATSLPDETGILPDHTVTQSIDDYLNKVDAVKKYTIQLVRK